MVHSVIFLQVLLDHRIFSCLRCPIPKAALFPNHPAAIAPVPLECPVVGMCKPVHAGARGLSAQVIANCLTRIVTAFTCKWREQFCPFHWKHRFQLCGPLGACRCDLVDGFICVCMPPFCATTSRTGGGSAAPLTESGREVCRPGPPSRCGFRAECNATV